MLRKVVLKDLKQISGLYFAEMADKFRSVSEEPITAKEFEKRLIKNFKKHKMYVLDINGIKANSGKICINSSSGKSRIKGFIWHYKEGGEYNLEEIFVVEEGKSYGKLLMKFILTEAKNRKSTRLI